MTDRLPRTYESILATFAEQGGKGTLNVHGHVIAGTPPRPMPGDTIAWLKLVALGYVGGADGTMLFTDAGKAKADAIIKGRMKVGV